MKTHVKKQAKVIANPLRKILVIVRFNGMVSL